MAGSSARARPFGGRLLCQVCRVRPPTDGTALCAACLAEALRRGPLPTDEAPGAPGPALSAKPLRPWRCCRCGEMLAYVYLAPGSVVDRITCPRCREEQGRKSA